MIKPLLLLCCFLLPAGLEADSFTATDMLNLACLKDCQHRDYTSGFYANKEGCACTDYFAVNKIITKLPTNLRGRAITKEAPQPFFRIEY